MSNQVEIEVKVDNNTKGGLSGIDDTLKTIGDSATEAGEKMDRSFNRARDSMGRFVKDGESGSTRTKQNFDALDGVWDKVKAAADTFGGAFKKNLDAANGSVGDFVANVGKMGFTLAASQAAGTAASGGINLVVEAILGLAGAVPLAVGAFLALAPALLAVGGAAGAAISSLIGLGLTLATLKIGFGGIGAALSAHNQQMGGAGKAASNTAAAEKAAAERIVQASRTLRDAKEQEKEASENVTKAIADEIERRKELALDLQSAAAAAGTAKQAVVEAEEKNRRAQAAGSDWEKTEAANALAEAKADYAQRVGKVQELTKEKDKAAKTSVQQSDAVRTAMAREKDAQERVADAQHDLTVAKQKDATASAAAAGGVNAFADAMSKLSPNAQKLVYALIAISDRFDGIKKRVQDRLLAGFDKSVTDLANVWLPKLDGILGGLADHLNGMGKAWAKSLGSPDFVKDVQNIGKQFEGFIDDISDFGSSMIDAFGRIGAASGPVLKVIGGFIKDIGDKFDRWIKSAEKSGALQKFMDQATATLQQIFDILFDLGKVAKDFIDILFPDSAQDGGGALDAIDRALKSIDAWLNDKGNQKKIDNFMKALQGIYDFVVHDLGPIFVWVAKVLGHALALTLISIAAVIGAVKKIPGALASAWDSVVNKASSVFNWFGRMGSWLSNVLSGSFNGLKNGFRNVMNWVIGKWNNLNFTMPAILGGATYGVGHIPYMASGGIANGLTMINERGAELVKLPSGSMVYPSGQSKGMADRARGGEGGSSTLYIERSGEPLVDVLIEALAGKIRKRGGNVQIVLGTRGATTT